MPKTIGPGIICLVAIGASVVVCLVSPSTQNALILGTTSISGFFGWLRDK